MDLLDESGLTPGWIVGYVPELKLCASFAVKGTFQLKHQGVAEPAPAQDDLEGDVPELETSTGLKYTRDLTSLKARVDLLLSAVAYAPGGKPTDTLPVTFKVGGWSKMLAVIGDRTLTNGMFAAAVTPPATFVEMPIRWSRAFGGLEVPSNPDGRGRDPEKDVRQKEFFRQPNIVRMEEAGFNSLTLKEPAGFGPLAPEWPQRAKLAERGSYGAKWLKDTWPGPPRDFDISYFNAAPPDQQLPPGSLKGDETIEFFNLHPRLPKYASRLPGVRPRLFVLETGPGPDKKPVEQFREVNLQIDTLWADPAAEKLVLVWRGLHAVKSKGLKEISAVVIGREPLGQTYLPARHYHDLLIRKRKEREEKEKAQATPLPEILPLEIKKPDFDWAAWEKEVVAEEKQTVEELDAASKEALAETKEAAAKSLQKEGLPTAILNQPPILDPAAIAAQAAKDHAAMVQMNPGMAKLMLPPPTAAQLDADAMVKKEFADFEAEFAKPVVPETGPDAPPPPAPEEEAIVWTREQVEAHAARKQPFVRLDLRERDLSGIGLRGARFEDCVLAKVLLAGADLAGATFLRCSLSEAILKKATLSGASLRFCDLSKADLGEATLAKTVLDDSSCAEAKFEKSTLEEVSARRASFDKAVFKDAVLKQCDFSQSEFTGAAVAKISLGRSILKAVNAYGLQGAGADFQGCDLTNFRTGDGADLTEAKFQGAQASGSAWEGAVLDRANFLDAELTRANFAGASLQGSKFGRANLSKARLPEANLTKAEFQRANLFRCTLEGANLTGADFGGANLYEAEFLDAVRDQARFDAANLKGTKLA